MSTVAAKTVRGGIVLLDPATGLVRRVIALQYNPDTLTRSFQIKGMGESAERSEALRLRGPAVETLKVDVELDATEQLDKPDENDVVARHGLAPALAALEGMANPTSAQLLAADGLARSGVLEIAPMLAPLAVFVWGANRILPVRLTDLSITEEAFDVRLNPIRAKVSLGLRVLSVDDLGFDVRGGGLFIAALQATERLAAQSPSATLGALGIARLP
ncbi:MAG TPA: hypothetical protein VGO80_12625 [Solirubrobacteraceae bacterium]|jgi:hypothetical protein|nr:hypothetical protein [Solirubrobacteraceae bacterium]